MVGWRREDGDGRIEKAGGEGRIEKAEKGDRTEKALWRRQITKAG